MSVILFDLETTGLPCRAGVKFGEYHSYKETGKYEGARVVQISYMQCDPSLNMVALQDSVINSGGEFKIRNSHIHGITDAISEEEGENFDDVMNKFLEVLRSSDIVMAHNADFDVNVLKAELFRRGSIEVLEELSRKRVVCTMKLCKEVVNAKNVYQRLKYPTLKELYEFATHKQMKGAHDAKHDVVNMHEAVKSLLDRELIETL